MSHPPDAAVGDLSVEGRPVPTLSQLFLAFLGIAMSGFGGVLPWARRMLVERRRWLTGPEFTDILGLCQFLPGPNIINVSIAVGSRFRGLPGALSAISGLIGGPVLLMCAAGAFYARHGDQPMVRSIFAGVGAAAAGLVVAMAIKMAIPLIRERPLEAAPVALVGFVTVGLLRWPLAWVLPPLLAVGMAIAWWRRNR
ncbi:chromate transporter [Stella humosa]|uniref:Chromate transporter n=2 Tax=Stella humosa TaxID=94 RepID=A0A3N1L1J4_9PROT|nr:chromate transporter [Stella humosa]